MTARIIQSAKVIFVTDEDARREPLDTWTIEFNNDGTATIKCEFIRPNNVHNHVGHLAKGEVNSLLAAAQVARIDEGG